MDDLNDSARVNRLGIWASKRVFDRTALRMHVVSPSRAHILGFEPTAGPMSSHSRRDATSDFALRSFMSTRSVHQIRVPPLSPSMQHHPLFRAIRHDQSSTKPIRRPIRFISQSSTSIVRKADKARPSRDIDDSLLR
ncbi:hypothetical protein E4U54_004194 [Claviceps lovelessii]|nr:hypothetical protein E4U54_004194 [Claviceps lovelessii]